MGSASSWFGRLSRIAGRFCEHRGEDQGSSGAGRQAPHFPCNVTVIMSYQYRVRWLKSLMLAVALQTWVVHCRDEVGTSSRPRFGKSFFRSGDFRKGGSGAEGSPRTKYKLHLGQICPITHTGQIDPQTLPENFGLEKLSFGINASWHHLRCHRRVCHIRQRTYHYKRRAYYHLHEYVRQLPISSSRILNIPPQEKRITCQQFGWQSQHAR